MLSVAHCLLGLALIFGRERMSLKLLFSARSLKSFSLTAVLILNVKATKT